MLTVSVGRSARQLLRGFPSGCRVARLQTGGDEAMSSRINRAAPLCGGGAFLIFVARFVEGVADYALAGVGLVMVLVGLGMLLINRQKN